MKQSSCLASAGRGIPPQHLAIIMDGNGRWAEARGLPRSAGHRAGAGVVRQVVRGAAIRGIRTLTLYAFSSDNWRRPPAEVSALMRLLRVFLLREAEGCAREGIRVSVIGRRDRLARGIRSAIEVVETKTRHGTRMHLHLAVDYSGRDALVAAAAEMVREAAKEGRTAPQDPAPDSGSAPLDDRSVFAAHLARVIHAPAPLPPVDLLVRTGGEVRLSDFLPWECAYAEFHFTPCLWPDFDEAALDGALETFCERSRRFGGVSTAAATAHMDRERSPVRRRPPAPVIGSHASPSLSTVHPTSARAREVRIHG